MPANNSHWLGLGPITKAENKEAFAYLNKRNLPTDKNSLRQRVAKMRKRRDLNRYLRGREQAGTDPNSPWQIIFGYCDVGGTITFMHTSGPANQKDLYLHMIVTLAAHEIQYVDQVFFNNVAMTWNTTLSTRPTGVVLGTGTFDGLVKMQINYGSDSQSALSVPVGDGTDALNPVNAKWTSDHKQLGHAHVYFRFKWDPTVFKDGVPDITFRVLGLYSAIDPRTDGLAPGAQNAAILLYSYMRNTRWGLGLAQSDFNITRLNQAVNDCEDSISLAGGGSELRYLISSHFGADSSPGVVIEDILASMHARLAYVEGKFSILVGKARPSTVLTITADMILSDIDVVTKTPRADNFNAVRGSFVSHVNNEEESDFPAVRNSTYVTEDGGTVIYEDLTFSMVRSSVTAQRLAKIELEATRQGILVEFTARMDAYQAEPGEWVAVTYARFGWSAKVFEVMRSALMIEQDNTGNPYFAVRLTLQETASGVYDWSTGNETTFDVAPNTNLPNPYSVSDPTGLTLDSGTSRLYIRKDGTVFARMYASWTASPDAFVVNGGRYEIQYKKSADSDWQSDTPVAGGSTNTYILDVQDGVSYDVRIRAVSAMNSFGNWVTVTGHTVIGKTAPPADVSSLNVTVSGFGISLKWSTVSDLDVREYEIRYGASGASWSSIASTAIRVRASEFFFRSFSSGTYEFQVRALDTSGNYSNASASATLTVSAPSAPINYSLTQIDNNVLVDWDAPSSAIFPISHYKVYKGATFGGATLLGTVGGTFYTYIEEVGGSFTYWVTAVDTAGNEGTEIGQSITVYNPPDYLLIDSRTLNPNIATLVRALDEGNGLSFVTPINTTETWAQHFTTNSQTTFAGLIGAGYTYYAQPTPTSAGTADWTIDLGAVFAQNLITMSYLFTQVAGSTAVSPRISWKENIGDAWTDGTLGATQVFATNFRYVKVSFSCLGASNLALSRISTVFVKVDTKKQTDSGSGSAVSSDSGGTTVNFNLSFIDITSIVVTPQATSAVNAVVDFSDVPNPTSFKVLLFNTSGTRVSGDFRWTAEGIIDVI